jgi:hypothetical protein
MNLGLGLNISSIGTLPFLRPYLDYITSIQSDGADTPPLKAIEHGTQVELDFSRIRSVPTLLCTCDVYLANPLLANGKLYTIIPE